MLLTTSVSRASRLERPFLGSPGPPSRQPRQDPRYGHHGREQNRPGDRQQHENSCRCEQRDRGPCRPRHQRSQEDVLDCVDVTDEAGQQVTTAKRRQAGGRKLFELCEDGHAQVDEHAQGGIVSDQPLSDGEASARPTAKARGPTTATESASIVMKASPGR